MGFFSFEARMTLSSGNIQAETSLKYPSYFRVRYCNVFDAINQHPTTEAMIIFDSEHYSSIFEKMFWYDYNANAKNYFLVSLPMSRL